MLLANAIATGGALVALTLTFSQVSDSDTFSGDRPADVPGFIAARLLGAAAAAAFFRWLDSAESRESRADTLAAESEQEELYR